MIISIYKILLSWVVVGTFLFSPQVLAEDSKSVYISEVFYSRSDYSSFDKWVELYNPTDTTVNLQGYTLTVGKNNFAIPLNGMLESGGYFIIQNSRADELNMLTNLDVTIDQSNGRLYWLSNKSTEETHITLSLHANGSKLQTIAYDAHKTNELLGLKNTSLECSISSCTPSTYNWNGYLVSPKIQLYQKPSPVIEPILVKASQPAPVTIETKTELSNTIFIASPVTVASPALVASTIEVPNSSTQVAIDLSQPVLSEINSPIVNPNRVPIPNSEFNIVPKLQATTFSRSIIKITIPEINNQKLDYVSNKPLSSQFAYGIEEIKLLFSIVIVVAWIRYEFSKQQRILTNFASPLRLSSYV